MLVKGHLAERPMTDDEVMRPDARVEPGESATGGRIRCTRPGC